MGKLRKWVLYLTIPVALIVIIQSVFYYASSGFTSLEVFLCTLENTVKAFMGRPTINSFYGIIYSPKDTAFQKVITDLYVLMIIVAPILTTTAILAGFRSYLWDFWYSVRITSKKNMFIIGDGPTGGKAAVKYADRYFVHYLMPAKTANEVRLPYLQKKIWAYGADYENIAKIMKQSHAEKAACIVLDYKDWFDHLEMVTQILEYLVRSNPAKPVPVCLINAPALFHDVFNGIYEGMRKKFNPDNPAIQVSFYDTDEINAKLFFEKDPLTKQPENRHHILLAGLGVYGTAFLTELGHHMMQNGFTGTVEIFDSNLEQQISDIMYSPDTLNNREKHRVTEPEKNASLSVDMETSAAVVRINYYQAAVGSLNFTKFMKEIAGKEKLTEVFLCIGDTSVNFELYRMLAATDLAERGARVFLPAIGRTEEILPMLDRFGGTLVCLPSGLPDAELF